MTGVARRRWVVWVAATSFCAGLAVGLALPVAAAAFGGPAPAISPDEDFVRDFAARYRLREDQVRSLRMILASDLAETTSVIRAKPETLPPEVRNVRRRTDERIQVLLDDEQRASYQRDKDR